MALGGDFPGMLIPAVQVAVPYIIVGLLFWTIYAGIRAITHGAGGRVGQALSSIPDKVSDKARATQQAVDDVGHTERATRRKEVESKEKTEELIDLAQDGIKDNETVIQYLTKIKKQVESSKTLSREVASQFHNALQQVARRGVIEAERVKKMKALGETKDTLEKWEKSQIDAMMSHVKNESKEVQDLFMQNARRQIIDLRREHRLHNKTEGALDSLKGVNYSGKFAEEMKHAGEALIQDKIDECAKHLDAGIRIKKSENALFRTIENWESRVRKLQKRNIHLGKIETARAKNYR